QGAVLDANPAACEMHGMAREDLIGRNACDLVPPEQREKLSRDMPQWFSDPVTIYESNSLTAGQQSVPVDIRATPIRYAGQPALLLHVRDITERKQAEEALRELSAQLLQAQDEERRRLARELHDTTAQHLAALVLNLS